MIKKIISNHVDRKITNWYEATLSSFLKNLPDEVAALISIDKITRGYVAVVDIELQKIHFMAKAIRKDPIELMSILLSEIYDQMTRRQLSLKNSSFAS